MTTSFKQKLIEVFKASPEITNETAAKLAGCSREHTRRTRAWIDKGMPALNYGAGVQHNYPKIRKPSDRSRYYKQKTPGTRIKCLGHLEPAHYFLSEDTKYNRVCSRCKNTDVYQQDG